MTTMKIRGAAVLLALALVAVTLPVTPAAADHDTSDCEADERYNERGWVGVSHPGVNQDVRVSQTLYLRLFNGDFAPTVLDPMVVDPINLREWTNGQDAYVVDLPCQTDTQQNFCVERLDLRNDRNGFVGLPILQPDDHDYRVAFYGTGPTYPLIEDTNPTAKEGYNPDDPNQHCEEDAPAGATFAVVYLASGTVSGIQADEDLYGPYTEHFDFHFEGPKA